MITNSELTPAQSKWLALIEYYFADVYSSGIITHAQMKVAHDKFMELRAVDKKYKTGWPIWLITKNQISRGVYKLPIADESVPDVIVDEDVNHPFYAEYLDELKQFNVVK